MSEQDRSRLYAWWCEQADESLAEYVMSCLSPVPLPDLATTSDIERLETAFARLETATRDDIARLDTAFERLESKFERLVDAREADRKEARHQFRWLAGIGVSILGVVVGLGIFS
ncbi:hypothetical protein [Candidatus Poriferisodalis sp.]|uniref:hypothetical protein n=1 Tax=Candidatus Poriferisodalis sp. TaxID=3101277 RepID=UPI003B0294C6